MGNVNAWAVTVKNIFLPHLSYSIAWKVISKGLCISFYVWLYPSTASIPVEQSAYTWHYSQKTCSSSASQALVAVKAQKPRLTQSRRCSGHWVGDSSLSVTDAVTSVSFALSKRSKHPHRCGSCRSSRPYFLSPPSASALHPTSQTL